MRTAGALLTLVLIAAAIGCQPQYQPQPGYPGANPWQQPPQNQQQPGWRQPNLGPDPDAYRQPYPQRQPCDGPNCPY